MKRFSPILVLILTAPLFGQGVRIDLPLRASGPNVPVSGGPLPQSLILANSKVSICAHPAPSLGSCTPVATYTDATLVTQCPTNMPIVQLPGSACVDTTGITGNLGFWYAGGVIDYFVSGPYGLQGPFTTSGGTTGPPGATGPQGPPGTAGNPAAPAFAVQFANSGATQFNADSTITINPTTHTVASPNTSSSVNRVLAVTAPPYNAKCDGTTDDQAAIQAAFNDALVGSSNPLCTANGCSIQFPAGTCKFSTIVYKGQSFFGAGMSISALTGEACEDNFQGPDTAFNYPYGTYIHDLHIIVDASCNAAATAAGGNNAFPNRITGTAGGTTPLPASSGGPPAPGQVHFGPGGPTGTCSAVVTNSSATVTMSCGKFTAASTDTIINQPISLTTTDGTLTTTIASVTNATTIVLATPWILPNNTTASGFWGTPYNAPWYVGNCGIAIPNSDHLVAITGVNGWAMKNVWFDSTTSNVTLNSHNCGLFLQVPPNDGHFDKLDFQHLFIGYAEAFPALNMSAGVTWTPDTASYKDMNFKFNRINMVTYNGAHRTINGIYIYTGNNPMLLSFWQLSYAQGSSTSTITHYYNECWSPNTGEISRFGGTPTNVVGGSLTQCSTYAPPNDQYVGFTGNFDTVDAQIGSVHISGDGNAFHHIIGSGGAPTYVTDTIGDNSVDGIVSSGGTVRRTFKNRPRVGVGGVDAGYMLMGNSAYPFANAADLISTCIEWPFPFLVANGAPGCTPDYNISSGGVLPAADGNVFGSYAHLTLANYPSGFTLGNGGAFGNGPVGKQFTIGDRLPQNPSNILNVIGRCDNPCTQTVSVRDARTNSGLGSGTLSFGTTWTSQSITGVDLNTGTLAGDVVNLNFGAIAGSGVTYEDMEVIGWEPQNADANAGIAQAPAIETLISANTLAGNIVWFPCTSGLRWTGTQPAGCVTTDTASPTGQTVSFLTGGSGHTYLSSINGATWAVGTQTPAQPTSFVVWGYASTGFADSVTVQCASTTLATLTITWTTSYAPYPINNVPFNACSPGDAILLRFNTNPTVDREIGAILQVPVGSNLRVASGFCSGTATASSTLLLSGFGAPIAACTSTLSTGSVAMQLMPFAGTLSNLSVRCGTTGVLPASGVFTVWIVPSGTAANGGSATTLTKTYGTTTAGTVLTDPLHTAAYNAGDSIQIRFTTQGSETLADCTASVNY